MNKFCAEDVVQVIMDGNGGNGGNAFSLKSFLRPRASETGLLTDTSIRGSATR